MRSMPPAIGPLVGLLSAIEHSAPPPVLIEGGAGPRDPIGRFLRKATRQTKHRAGWPTPGSGKREIARRLRQMAGL